MQAPVYASDCLENRGRATSSLHRDPWEDGRGSIETSTAKNRGCGFGCRALLTLSLATVAAIVLFSDACATGATFAAPERITVVTDFDYPPFLFTSDDGELKGIIRDKWRRWSERTGIPAEVKGKTWIEAQRSVQEGIDDVIETLSFTPERAGLYEYSQPYAPVEAKVYFHRSISGISDVGQHARLHDRRQTRKRLRRVAVGAGNHVTRVPAFGGTGQRRRSRARSGCSAWIR